MFDVCPKVLSVMLSCSLFFEHVYYQLAKNVPGIKMHCLLISCTSYADFIWARHAILRDEPKETANSYHVPNFIDFVFSFQIDKVWF